MTISLPAFLAGFLLILNFSLKQAKLNRMAQYVAMLMFIGFSLVGSLYSLHLINQEGLYQKTLSDGTNMLVRRAATVNLVRESLLKHRSTLPSNSVILFKDIDIWAFNKDNGPRVWYGDATLKAYDISHLDLDPRSGYIRSTIEIQGESYTGAKQRTIVLDKSRTFIYRRQESDLLPIPLDDMKSLYQPTSITGESSK